MIGSKFLHRIQIKSAKNFVSLLSTQPNKVTAAKTALYDFHVEKKGKIVDFGGYLLPVQYADLSISESHLHTRKHASIFDVSHMLQTEIRGKDCVDYFETLCTADIKRMADGSASLTVFTNENGGIMDDLIVTKISNEHLYVVSNCARKDSDMNIMTQGLVRFKEMMPGAKADLRFFTVEERGLLALQGPESQTVLQSITPKYTLNNLFFMQSVLTTVAGIDGCRITRCGYTGEDGFEISVPSSKCVQLAGELLERNESLKLAGLGARDSLRLEAGLCLYGNDIDETTTPVEATLTWLVAKTRRDENNFPGASIIRNQIPNKVTRKRIGIISQNGPPARHHTEIYMKNGEEKVKIGVVTSGLPSPSLPGTNIAMGYVKKEYSKAGTDVLLNIRNKFYEANVSKMPFVATNYYINK